MEWWAIWLIVAGVLLIVEMLTLTFYLLWLGLGALVAVLTALLFPDSFIVQALAGAIAAVVLTVFTKQLTRRFRESRGYRDAVNELVGKQGIVLEDIAPDRPGIVKVGSETWSATSVEVLKKDEAIIVVNRGTTVLEVHKWGGVT